MIYPVPQGVHPNTHCCGCGQPLLMPWVHVLQDHVLWCMADPAHDTYQVKYSQIRTLQHPERGEVEVDEITGEEMT